MAATVALSPPEPLKKKGDLGENWNVWKQNFKIYLIAAGIEQYDKRAGAHFLHTIGQYGRDIFNDLEISEEEPLEEYFTKFDNYCNPKTNLTFNRYQFFNTKQEKNQQFDKFLLVLKQKSKNCEFGDLNNSLMMTQIISGINNTRLRERLLKKNELDLNATIEECRSTEVAEAQAQKISAAKTQKKPDKANTENKQGAAPPAGPKTEKKQHKQQKGEKNQQEKPTTDKKEEQESTGPKRVTNCKFCGGSHAYGNCPAFGSTCNKCQKPNHYSKVCKN